MAGRSGQQREAAGTAAYRRSLSRFGCALSAWVAGPLLVLGAVSLSSALADQHGGPHGSAPHMSGSHMSAPHFSAPHGGGASHYAAPRYAAPRGIGRGFSPSYGHPAYGAPSYGSPAYRNERSFAGQPARPFAPPQNNSPNRGYPAPRPQQGPQPQNGQPNGHAGGEHLGSWMRQHQNQSLADQERALHQEPGFNRLAPQQQQNLVNRLHQLDQMPPQQRARTMERVENMERLSPERRQAVRSSAQQLGTLPQDRKRMVQKAFRDLREMPPEQRRAVLNSPQFAGQFSAQERSIMGNLLTVEPYQHAGPNMPQPQYGRQF